jgi:hypothetical protein
MARHYIENVEAVTYSAVIKVLVATHSFDVCQCLDSVAFEELGHKSTIANCHHNEYASSPQLPPGVVHRLFSQSPLTNLYVAQSARRLRLRSSDPVNGDENYTSQEPVERRKQNAALFSHRDNLAWPIAFKVNRLSLRVICEAHMAMPKVKSLRRTRKGRFPSFVTRVQR